jgi:hypothetical protein
VLMDARSLFEEPFFLQNKLIWYLKLL